MTGEATIMPGKLGFTRNDRTGVSVQNDGMSLIVTAPTVGLLVEAYSWVFNPRAAAF